MLDKLYAASNPLTLDSPKLFGAVVDWCVYCSKLGDALKVNLMHLQSHWHIVVMYNVGKCECKWGACYQ